MAKKKKAEDEVRYGEAVQEIERILESIDGDEIDVDELSDKVERAVTLIRVCQEKLRATESRVTRILDDLGSEMETAGKTSSPEQSPQRSLTDALADEGIEEGELPFE